MAIMLMMPHLKPSTQLYRAPGVPVPSLPESVGDATALLQSGHPNAVGGGTRSRRAKTSKNARVTAGILPSQNQ